jgi:hypothetical protein
MFASRKLRRKSGSADCGATFVALFSCDLAQPKGSDGGLVRTCISPFGEDTNLPRSCV